MRDKPYDVLLQHTEYRVTSTLRVLLEVSHVAMHSANLEVHPCLSMQALLHTIQRSVTHRWFTQNSWQPVVASACRCLKHGGCNASGCWALQPNSQRCSTSTWWASSPSQAWTLVELMSSIFEHHEHANEEPFMLSASFLCFHSCRCRSAADAMMGTGTQSGSCVMA